MSPVQGFLPLLRIRGFVPYLLTQALSAFNHNLLRSSLLTLVAFRGLGSGIMPAETIVAYSTILLVAPFFFLSLPGGKLADKWPKTLLIRRIKLFEIGVFCLAAYGLAQLDVVVLLVAILLAGIEAALFGPPKFGILPELVGEDLLVPANALVGASNFVAILLGLVVGNLLSLGENGLFGENGLMAVTYGGVVIASTGWLLTFLIPPTGALAPDISLTPSAILKDFRVNLIETWRTPGLISPMLGNSWFWFQGSVNTSLFPLFAKQWMADEAASVTLLLLASLLGAALGALASRWVFSSGNLLGWVPFFCLAVIALPGIDLWLAVPATNATAAHRVIMDVFLMSVGTGIYVVPLNAAIQRLSPANTRARLIGVNHTMNGLALIGSGFAILVLRALGLTVPDMFLGTSVLTGVIAALMLRPR